MKSGSGEVSQQTRCEALRRGSDVIAAQAELNEVLMNLAQFLPSAVGYEFLGVILYDAERQVFRLHAFRGSLPSKSEVGAEISLSESSAAAILQDQQPVVVNDTENETGSADLVERASPCAVRLACPLLLTPPGRRLGVLVFGTTHQKDYSEEDLRLMSMVAAHVANGIATDYHIDEEPMIEQDHFSHLAGNRTFVRQADWRHIDEVLSPDDYSAPFINSD